MKLNKAEDNRVSFRELMNRLESEKKFDNSLRLCVQEVISEKNKDFGVFSAEFCVLIDGKQGSASDLIGKKQVVLEFEDFGLDLTEFLESLVT